IPCLGRLIEERLVSEANVAAWLPAGKIFSDVLAQRARVLRGRGPFPQKVWSRGAEKFVGADPSDVNRLETPGAFTPLDLCEHVRLVPACKNLVDECVRWTRSLYANKGLAGRLWGRAISTGAVANGVAAS